MTKRLIVAGSVGCLSLLLDQSGHSGVVLIAQSAPARSGAIVQSASPDNLKVVLLGSGMGPRVNLQQFGASTLIEAANLRLLFDCGRGATLRLAREILIALQARFGAKLFDTIIHQSAQLREVVARGAPVQVLAPASRAASDFAALADEICALESSLAGAKSPAKLAREVLGEDG